MQQGRSRLLGLVAILALAGSAYGRIVVFEPLVARDDVAMSSFADVATAETGEASSGMTETELTSSSSAFFSLVPANPLAWVFHQLEAMQAEAAQQMALDSLFVQPQQQQQQQQQASAFEQQVQQMLSQVEAQVQEQQVERDLQGMLRQVGCHRFRSAMKEYMQAASEEAMQQLQDSSRAEVRVTADSSDGLTVVMSGSYSTLETQQQNDSTQLTASSQEPSQEQVLIISMGDGSSGSGSDNGRDAAAAAVQGDSDEAQQLRDRPDDDEDAGGEMTDASFDDARAAVMAMLHARGRAGDAPRPRQEPGSGFVGQGADADASDDAFLGFLVRDGGSAEPRPSSTTGGSRATARQDLLQTILSGIADTTYDADSDASSSNTAAATAVGTEQASRPYTPVWPRRLDLDADGLPELDLVMFHEDGQLNWPLLALLVLIAGTAAVLAWFVQAFFELRAEIARGNGRGGLMAGMQAVPVIVERNGRRVHGMVLVPRDEGDGECQAGDLAWGDEEGGAKGMGKVDSVKCWPLAAKGNAAADPKQQQQQQQQQQQRPAVQQHEEAEALTVVVASDFIDETKPKK